MSKRRRGLSVGAAGQAWSAHRRRRWEGAAREARERRPLPLRVGTEVQALLPERRTLSTAAAEPTTTGSR